MNTLERLQSLRGSLSESAGQDDFERWWTEVQFIESDLESDPRRTAADDANLARLKSGVSDLILAIREGLNPHLSIATVPLTALENSLRRRGFGPDGWPLG